MAFTYTVREPTVMGDRAVVFGNYTNTAGSTGGDIVTGLNVVEAFFLTPRGSAVNTGVPVYNESALPQSGTITIVTDATTTGSFMAIGSV